MGIKVLSFKNLFLLIFLFIVSPSWLLSSYKVGLDPSWTLAINYAFENNLIFGKDFLFTYGPLGFLIARSANASSWFPFIFFDLFLLLCYSIFINSVTSITENRKTIYLSLILLALVLQNTIGPSTIEILFTLQLFFSLEVLVNKNVKSKYGKLFLSNIIAILLFYMKANLGLVSIFSSIIITSLSLYYSNKKYLIVVFFIVLPLFILTTSILLNVDLYSYIVGSIHIINGYNEVMFFPLRDNKIYVLYAALSTIILVLVFLINKVKKYGLSLTHTNFKFYIVSVFLLGFIYLLFKQSFVRADNHVYSFFKVISLTLFCYYILYLNFNFKGFFFRNTFYLSIVFSLFFLITGAKWIPYYFFNPLRKVQSINKYISSIKGFDKRGELIELKKLAQLPKASLNIVKNGSVDIFSNDLSEVFYNKLNYNPRPVMQTYSAYNQFLDEKNALKYRSTTSPDFVIFKNESIDNRYSIHDEGETKLELLKKYDIIDVIPEMVILKKRDNPLEFHQFKVDTIVSTLNTWIDLPEGNYIMKSKVFIKNTLLGTLRTFFYHPKELKFQYLTNNKKESKQYKVVKPILNSGVILNKKITSLSDYALLFDSKSISNENILKVKFLGDDLNYTSEIKLITEYYKTMCIDSSFQGLGENLIKYVIRGDIDRNVIELYDTIGLFGEKPIKLLLKKNSKEFLFSVLKNDKSEYYSSIPKSIIEDPFNCEFSFVEESNNSYRVLFPFKKISLKDEIYANRLVKSSKELSINYSIDVIDTIGSNLRIAGWCYLDGQSTENKRAYISLSNNENETFYPCENILRKSITNKFGKGLNLDYAGFRCLIPLEHLINKKNESIEIIIHDNTNYCNTFIKTNRKIN